MTDITDQEKRVLREWANENQLRDEETHLAASYILATVDAPAPALAEELRDTARWWGDGAPTWEQCCDRFDALAARAEQLEHDLAQARAEAKTWREQDENDCEAYMEELKSVREALAVEGRRVEKIAKERDEARAEVQRLTAQNTWPKHTPSGHTYDAPTTYKKLLQQCANAAQATTEGWDDAERPPEPIWAMVGLATTEVEHLTAKNEQLRSDVQKGAESNAETPDPADVKPGEAWKALIWYDDVRYPGTAIKSSGGDWVVIRDGGSHSTFRMNEYVELVSRLVPAPRVITNTDELEEQVHGTIIRDGAGDMYQKILHGWYRSGSEQVHRSDDNVIMLPVTVLWEPEA